MRVLAVQRGKRIAASCHRGTGSRTGSGHVQRGLARQQRIRVLLDEIGSAGRHAEQVRRGGGQTGCRFRGMALDPRWNG